MQQQVSNELNVNDLVNALESAVKVHPDEYWRYELLASAYVTRAETTGDLAHAARDLKAAGRLRSWLAENDVDLGPQWEGLGHNHTDETTIPFFKVGASDSQAPAAPLPVKLACDESQPVTTPTASITGYHPRVTAEEADEAAQVADKADERVPVWKTFSRWAVLALAPAFGWWLAGVMPAPVLHSAPVVEIISKAKATAETTEGLGDCSLGSAEGCEPGATAFYAPSSH